MKKVLIALFILSTLGCNKGGDRTASSGGGSIEDLRAAPNGWKTGCIADGSDSLETNFKVVDNTIFTSTTYYDGSACAVVLGAVQASASILPRGTSTALASATAIDVKPKKLEWKPLSGSAATLYNSQSLCGKTNWADNQWIDVTASSSCFTDNTSFDIMKITGSNLLFGADTGANDGSTEAKRKTVLETSGFTKY